MKVIFASDHAGYDLKTALVAYVAGLGYETEDLGPHEYVPEDDYTDTIAPLAKAVAKEPAGVFGVAIGGSGQGEAIVANRMKGVRAGVYYGGNLGIVETMREHNDANVLSIGARFLPEEEAKEAVKLFLETAFSEDERHIRRIKEIDE